MTLSFVDNKRVTRSPLTCSRRILFLQGGQECGHRGTKGTGDTVDSVLPAKQVAAWSEDKVDARKHTPRGHAIALIRSTAFVLILVCMHCLCACRAVLSCRSLSSRC